ncbi:MAG: glycosyltransferase family 9 protein [Bacteroidota bacterium]
MLSNLSNESINKILIIRLSSLGDVLLATPVIRALKQKHPNSQIDFVVKKQYEEVLKNNPYLHKLYIYGKDKAEELRYEVRSTKYDLIIDLQNNFRSRTLTGVFHLQIRRFKKPALKKLLLVYFKINFLKELKTIPQRYAETADVQLDDKGLELLIPEDVKPQLENEKNYIGFCPGSKHFTKRWLPEYFVQLGNELTKEGFTIVLFGGKSDKELCEEIFRQIDGCVNLQNNDRLLQTAADMKKCRLIFTNDSGLMHTVTAVGVPLVAVFGSTVCEFGFAPYAVHNSILENKSLSCRPCSHIGRSSCPRKHFRCMKDITPQLVFNHIKDTLSRL